MASVVALIITALAAIPLFIQIRRIKKQIDRNVDQQKTTDSKEAE